MISQSKDWIIVFNGEVYNYLNLKKFYQRKVSLGKPHLTQKYY